MLSAGLRNPTKSSLDLGADCSSSEDERVPLLPRGASSIQSDGAPGPRLRQRQRTSLYRNMPALVQREWGELMGETESLDTDALINTLDIDYVPERGGGGLPKPLISRSKLRGLLKWAISGLIGISVGLTAYGMERAIEGIVYARIQLVDRLWRPNGTWDETGPNAWHQWHTTTLTGCQQHDSYMLCGMPGCGPSCGRAFGAYAAVALSCTLVTTLLVVRLGPAAAGSGVSLVMAYLNGIHVPKLLSFKTLVVKIVGTVLTVASTLPLGPEGPLVHIGAGIASFFTRNHAIFKRDATEESARQGLQAKGVGELEKMAQRAGVHAANARPKKELVELLLAAGNDGDDGRQYFGRGDVFNNDFARREFISSGAAVGLAAAFGAPIGGVLFSLEEASSFWSQRVTWRAMLCTTLGCFTLALLHGEEGTTDGPLEDPRTTHSGWKIGSSGLLSFDGLPKVYYMWELIPFTAIAVCCGTFGALFVECYGRLAPFRQKRRLFKVLEVAVLTLLVAGLSFFLPIIFGKCMPMPCECSTHGPANPEYPFLAGGPCNPILQDGESQFDNRCYWRNPITGGTDNDPCCGDYKDCNVDMKTGQCLMCTPSKSTKNKNKKQYCPGADARHHLQCPQCGKAACPCPKPGPDLSWLTTNATARRLATATPGGLPPPPPPPEECQRKEDCQVRLRFNCAADEYNDLATLFLSYREGVINMLMEMNCRWKPYFPHCQTNPQEVQMCQKEAPTSSPGVPPTCAKSCLVAGASCVAPCKADDCTKSTFSERSLAVFFIANFGCIVLAFGTSVPSGLFMPSIMTGAAFGGLIGYELRSMMVGDRQWQVQPEDYAVEPGLYALVGAAAMLAGVFRSTISLTVILLEGTGQIQYLLPIILTIGVSKITADRFGDGLNEVTLELARLPFLHHEPSSQMGQMTAVEADRADDRAQGRLRPVTMFRSVESVATIAARLECCGHNGFPVCTVEPADLVTDAPERWLFDGIILRSQLLVILSRRAFLEAAATPAGTGDRGVAMPRPRADIQSGRPQLIWTGSEPRDEVRQLVKLDTAMREYHHRHNFHSRSVSSTASKIWQLGLDDEEKAMQIDLSPYVNLAPLAVRNNCPLSRVFTQFRTMGLRHAVVTDRHNAVVGIITRKDLARLQNFSHAGKRVSSSTSSTPSHSPVPSPQREGGSTAR